MALASSTNEASRYTPFGECATPRTMVALTPRRREHAPMPNLKEKGARVPRRRRINLHRGIAGSAAILALGGAFATTSAFAAAPAAPAGASATILTLNNTTAQLLPDGANVTSTIQVAGAQNVIRDVDLITNIPHTSSGDLRIRLKSRVSPTR